jgi:hypothetical protein
MKCLEVYSIISATWEAETGGPWVQGHSGQTSETVFQTKLNKPKRNKETFSRNPSSIWYLALFLKLFFLASYISEGFLFCFVVFVCFQIVGFSWISNIWTWKIFLNIWLYFLVWINSAHVVDLLPTWLLSSIFIFNIPCFMRFWYLWGALLAGERLSSLGLANSFIFC